MKDGNYYTVYGWMINRLKLKGTTLQLYAVIYGFSENGENECCPLPGKIDTKKHTKVE